MLWGLYLLTWLCWWIQSFMCVCVSNLSSCTCYICIVYSISLLTKYQKLCFCGLNVDVSSKFICYDLAHNVIVLRSEAFEKWLSQEIFNIVSGINVLIEEAEWDTFSLLSYEDIVKKVPSWCRGWAHTRRWICLHLHFDLEIFRF